MGCDRNGWAAAMSGEMARNNTNARNWLYRADPPQRYLGADYSSYLRCGGAVRLEEFVSGFVAGGANHHDIARFFFFCLIFDQLIKEGVEGELVELGAYRGHTASLLAKMARKLDRIAYILDTFTRFDPADVTGVDASVTLAGFRDTSREAVRALVGEDNVHYIKGGFPQTAGQLPADGRYCLMHIDCDLYAPILSALQYFYPRVAPGGFLVIHDYSSPHWRGAEKAVDEFFADKAEAPVPLPDSAGSVVVRKARVPDASDTWLLRRRAALLGFGWVSAGNGALREALGDGWSGPEGGGVLGIGEPISCIGRGRCAWWKSHVTAGRRLQRGREAGSVGIQGASQSRDAERAHSHRRIGQRWSRIPGCREGGVYVTYSTNCRGQTAGTAALALSALRPRAEYD